MKYRHLIFLAAGVATLAGCGVQYEEQNRTRENREAINSGIPVPQLEFSMRRWVMAKFYTSLERPRLRSCTIITSRGGDRSILAIAPSYGTSVNLSNQMTEPGMSEPDSVYSGPNDQTVVVLRNGTGVVTESDTSTVLGECPENVEKPDTVLQQTIDFQSSKPPEFDFLAPEKPPSGSK